MIKINDSGTSSNALNDNGKKNWFMRDIYREKENDH